MQGLIPERDRHIEAGDLAEDLRCKDEDDDRDLQAGREAYPQLPLQNGGQEQQHERQKAGIDALDLAVEGRADEHADHDEPDHGIDDERQLALLLQAQLFLPQARLAALLPRHFIFQFRSRPFPISTDIISRNYQFCVNRL